jgi:hypothetical protein
LKLLSPKDVAKDYPTIGSVATVILYIILVRVLRTYTYDFFRTLPVTPPLTLMKLWVLPGGQV